MITGIHTFTVEDINKLALPLGTTVLAGGDALSRPVRWVVTVNAEAPPYFEGGEFVLLAPGKKDINELVQVLSDHDVAGVACLHPLTSMTLAAADMLHLPILQLPGNANLRDIERAVIGLLLDRHDQVERRSMQIYQQLVQLVSENIGLERLTQELSNHVKKAVVVQDKHLRIMNYAIQPQYANQWDEVAEAISERRAVPTRIQDRHRLPRHTTATVFQNIGDSGFFRLICPIVTKDTGRGYLSFVGLHDDFDETDNIVIGHGAVICALEMARAKAISEVEKKLRGDFLDSLMTGAVGEAEAQMEGDRYNHDMTSPHVALVLTWYGSRHPSNRRLETLVNGLISGRQLPVLTHIRENEIRLFCAADTTTPIQAARELAETIRAEARREYQEARIAIGIGSLASRINDWRISYREAAQAADIARRLQADSPLYIGDLGIYTFLARPDYRDDLRALRDSTIGPLLQHEEKQRADLLLTLEAFFQCHGNHTQTAELLSVHRNTLFYRMNRIADITGLDLNRPDVRLAVHLALKIHRLLTAEG